MLDRIFVSSTGKGVSLTMTGLSLQGLLPVIAVAVELLRSFGVNIEYNVIVQLLEGSILLGGLLMFLAGLIRKIYLRLS